MATVFINKIHAIFRLIVLFFPLPLFCPCILIAFNHSSVCLHACPFRYHCCCFFFSSIASLCLLFLHFLLICYFLSSSFSNIYFHLVRTFSLVCVFVYSMLPIIQHDVLFLSHADVFLYVLYVRTILLRVISRVLFITFFLNFFFSFILIWLLLAYAPYFCCRRRRRRPLVHLVASSSSFSGSPAFDVSHFIRAITFRLNCSRLCVSTFYLVRSTFIFKFNAHMRDGKCVRA